jgi:hypothetical protein
MAEDEAGMGQDGVSFPRCWAGRSQCTERLHVAAWRACSWQQKDKHGGSQSVELLCTVSAGQCSSHALVSHVDG